MASSYRLPLRPRRRFPCLPSPFRKYGAAFRSVQLAIVPKRGADVALHNFPPAIRNRKRRCHQLRVSGKTAEVGESPVVEPQLVSEGRPSSRVDTGVLVAVGGFESAVIGGLLSHHDVPQREPGV